MATDLHERLRLACRWLTETAMVRDDATVDAEARRRLPLRAWTGAVRGEYRAATRQWGFFCPVWHTGQAVKALCLASEHLGDECLGPARTMADFILANQLPDGPDQGLLLAYEDFPDRVNTSAVLEALDGLLHLSQRTGDDRYARAALAALRWVADRAWIPGEGLFRDLYDVQRREFASARHFGAGRPLFDDGVFLAGWRLTGEEAWRAIAIATGERLLRDEDPPGNWVRYQPCRRQTGSIHPRHAYWWGLPMLALWDETGDARFLGAFTRAVTWYRHALRTDGGMFRDTRCDFRTASFGHATSGSAAAAILFVHALRAGEAWEVLPDLRLALQFCLRMQFTRATDPNLAGAILEKVLPPDGSDQSPYHLRDLGTIFFVQALSLYLAARRDLELLP